MLFDEQKQLTAIESMNHAKTIPKYFPLQFSVVLRNVLIDIEISFLLTCIKNNYPNI